LFTELQATYEVRKYGKKHRRLWKSPLKAETQPQSDNKLPPLHLSDKLPPLDLNTEFAPKTCSSKKKSVIKHRSVSKAKYRNKSM
jgi:hypothetical protein